MRFIEERMIAECSLLAHELIRDFNKEHGKRACIKVDVQKAFDSINREFVYYTMHCMKFPINGSNGFMPAFQVPLFQSWLMDHLLAFQKQQRHKTG